MLTSIQTKDIRKGLVCINNLRDITHSFVSREYRMSYLLGGEEDRAHFTEARHQPFV